jgi:hypothetical protein
MAEAGNTDIVRSTGLFVPAYIVAQLFDTQQWCSCSFLGHQKSTDNISWEHDIAE